MAQVCSHAAAVVDNGVVKVVDGKPIVVLDPIPMLDAVTVDVLAVILPEWHCATDNHNCPGPTSGVFTRRTLRGFMNLEAVGRGKTHFREKRPDGGCKLDGIFPGKVDDLVKVSMFAKLAVLSTYLVERRIPAIGIDRRLRLLVQRHCAPSQNGCLITQVLGSTPPLKEA